MTKNFFSSSQCYLEKRSKHAPPARPSTFRTWTSGDRVAKILQNLLVRLVGA
ncbi:MAG TPA: hypothetical protein IGS52_21555 [Oscillatoriaceae cyanobacterium M33_DOE_052]|nr:hypothetical protein [Oscillatoriaceae cyanobacterium M33_DOE_052]